MTDDATPTPDDDMMLAAEYVLRLLGPEDMAEAEKRLTSDTAFAAEVRRWQEYLAPLALAEGEIRPSPAAKDALMARVFDESRSTSSPPGAGIFRRWRWGLASALAVAVFVAALVFYPVTEPGPTHVAELQPAQRGFILTAALLMDDTPQLELTRMDGPAAPAGRATELWAIPPDGVPVSLGVVPDEENWIVNLPPDLAERAAELTLALSDEPEGGSPTGAPTGEVLAAVQLNEL